VARPERPARTYDPQTGRFTTRDAAEGDPFAPETLQPYAFANDNPWVFGDPTGRFSIGELVTSQRIEQILQRAQSAAANGLRSLMKDKIQEIVGNMIADVRHWGRQTGRAQYRSRKPVSPHDCARAQLRLGPINVYLTLQGGSAAQRARLQARAAPVRLVILSAID